LYTSRQARLDIELDAPRLKEIRIRITRTDGFEMPWTMSEIRVYQSAE
jgi:hypothetical protein